MKPGIKILDEDIGTGEAVQVGDIIEIEYDLYLNRGDIVQSNFRCKMTLGDRSFIAGLNYGIEGMRVGGRRRFKAGSHLCYGAAGVSGIPANAVLIFDVQLLAKAADGCLG
ncbi:MAG: FKBP-type peptidyl-prolyl cis-trans isomerase [Armatimonadetes bacterium]|nr:FKBP-type peptidyl-prolyl cis-trans isomerase [Armatimonadota bacterium]